MLVTEYEQAVYQQYGVIHPEQAMMIFRCVWEDLDMQLLPLTKQAEKEAPSDFRNHYWKQDSTLAVYTHRYMQLWRKVQMHKGPTWMSEEELRDHYSRRVAPRVALMEQLHLQSMQRRRVITLRPMQDFLVEWDNMYRMGVVDRLVSHKVARPNTYHHDFADLVEDRWSRDPEDLGDVEKAIALHAERLRV